MTITFALFTHFYSDDRVWFHQAASLNKLCDVNIVSAYSFLDGQCVDNQNINNITVSQFNHANFKRGEAFNLMAELISKGSPDVIVCDSPMAAVASKVYKDKFDSNVVVIQDVTEWYPSKKNLFGLSGPKKLLKKIVLTFVNFYSGIVSDGFIFGEKDKASMFRSFVKKKPFVFLPYYPDLQYINMQDVALPITCWNLCYCGNLTEEKGFFKVCAIVDRIAGAMPSIQFKFNIIGAKSDDVIPTFNRDNLSVSAKPFLPFETFCKTIPENHVFFDLREIDEENDKCLPIKLFYYMACGRPVVFSELSAIKAGVPEYQQIGAFLKDDVIENAVSYLQELIASADNASAGENTLYMQQSDKAYTLYREKYNWKSIEKTFVDFIHSFQNKGDEKKQ